MGILWSDLASEVVLVAADVTRVWVRDDDSKLSAVLDRGAGLELPLVEQGHEQRSRRPAAFRQGDAGISLHGFASDKFIAK